MTEPSTEERILTSFAAIGDPEKLRELDGLFGQLLDKMERKLEIVKEFRKTMYLRSLLPHKFDPKAEVKTTFDWVDKHTVMEVSCGKDNSVTIPWQEWDFDAVPASAVKHLANFIGNFSFEQRLYRIKKGEGDRLPVPGAGRKWRYGPERLEMEMRVRREMRLPLTEEEYDDLHS